MSDNKKSKGLPNMSDAEPKRIYNWQQSQLSVARHYGGCKINGIAYIIRYDLEGQPLEEVVMKPKRKKEPRSNAKTKAERTMFE